MFYLKKFIFTTNEGENAIVELEPGLNIIYGPSNTGKSLIVDCIDFMFGGNPERLMNNPIGFKSCALILDVDGVPVFMSRDIDGRTINVSTNSNSVESGDYKLTKGKNSIYQFWLKLMGIDDEVKIVMRADYTPQTLGIRTFFHFFLIKENRMSSDLSILKNGEGYSNQIPIPTIMSLIYLLNGTTYTNGEKVKGEKIRDAENDAIKKFVDRSLMSIGQQKMDDLKVLEDEISPEELQEKIELAKKEISQAEENIKKHTEECRVLSNEVIQIDQKIMEYKVLRNRYDSLMTQYESDIKRLTFISEGEIHKDNLPKLDHCPFCNGEIPKDKEKSCIDAAIAEVRKIELQINDLLSAEEQLDEEIKSLILEGEQKDKLRHQLQEQIRAELEPKLSALNKELNSFRITLGRQKVAELYDKVANTICAEMEETLDNDISKTINTRELIKDNISGLINEILPKILKEADYESFVRAEFDVDSCDVKVNGINKSVQGQGYCAYLNAIMGIAIQEMLNKYGKYKTNFLVLDSPILSFAEKRKPGENMASEVMRAGLFRYMDEHTQGYQTIVIENYIPNINYNNAHLIEFTKDENVGRYGLVESYHVN